MGKTDKNKADRILREIKKNRDRKKVIHVEHERVELVIFTLRSSLFAFYGEFVKEILPYVKIAFVPGCPDSIIGIINVRGDIESVLNIHKIMKLPGEETTSRSRIIIGEKGDIRSGILVDSVEDVVNIPIESVERKTSILDKSISEFAVGGETLYKGRYVTILDMGKIFGGIAV